jgi:hypothetical protein
VCSCTYSPAACMLVCLLCIAATSCGYAVGQLASRLTSCFLSNPSGFGPACQVSRYHLSQCRVWGCSPKAKARVPTVINSQAACACCKCWTACCAGTASVEAFEITSTRSSSGDSRPFDTGCLWHMLEVCSCSTQPGHTVLAVVHLGWARNCSW